MLKRNIMKYNNKTMSIKIIKTLLALIVTLNNAIFNSKFYRHMKVCEMEPRYPPSDTSIFMTELEEKYIYSFKKQISMLYLRFIGSFFFYIDKIGELAHKLYERLQDKTSHNKIGF